jgi:hypothetical protein
MFELRGSLGSPRYRAEHRARRHDADLALPRLPRSSNICQSRTSVRKIRPLHDLVCEQVCRGRKQCRRARRNVPAGLGHVHRRLTGAPNRDHGGENAANRRDRVVHCVAVCLFRFTLPPLFLYRFAILLKYIKPIRASSTIKLASSQFSQ